MDTAHFGPEQREAAGVATRLRSAREARARGEGGVQGASLASGPQMLSRAALQMGPPVGVGAQGSAPSPFPQEACGPAALHNEGFPLFESALRLLIK